MEDRIGHNHPPSMIETAAETMNDLSAWMAEHPVVQTEEDAREAKVYLDRGKLCVRDMEDERDGKVRPLNEQVREINAYYKGPRTQLENVLQALQNRLTDFIREETRKREEAAEEAARLAEEAEQRAREAERIEQEAIESAKAGELGVDIAAHTVGADEAFRDYEKASRAAQIAEKDSHVKIGGGFSRAISLRQKETILVVNPIVALNEIGMTDDIRDAIIKSARAFRKLRGRLPGGVESEIREEL